MLNLGILSAVLAMSAFVVFLFFAAGIALYVLLALGLYKLAENSKIDFPWLAFIPVMQLYIVGRLVREINIFGYRIPYREYVLPAVPIVYCIFQNVFLIGFLLWLASAVVVIAALYYLFKRYKGENALLMTVLSIVLPFMGPIFIYQMRKCDPLD